MIQFMKFATVDPEGIALVKVEDISSFGPVENPDECVLVTNHENYRIRGGVKWHMENLQNCVGVEWEGVPEEKVSE